VEQFRYYSLVNPTAPSGLLLLLVSKRLFAPDPHRCV
jgi:hypothetical protein